MRFSLKFLTLLCSLAILLAGWVGNECHAAKKRSQELDRLVESGIEVEYSSIDSSRWFEEVSKHAVISISQRKQQRESKEKPFDLAHVQELEKLHLINDQQLSPETSKALVNLQELEFGVVGMSMRARRKVPAWSPRSGDGLIHKYATSLPVMPKLEKLTINGFFKNQYSKLYLLSDEEKLSLVKSGSTHRLSGRWVKGEDLKTLISKAPKLKQVDVKLYDITPELINAFAGHANLETVEISIFKSTPKQYRDLTDALLALPNLEQLIVTFPEGADEIAKNLQKVHNKLAIDFLQKLKSFDPIVVSNSKLKSISLAEIGKLEISDCPNLESIDRNHRVPWYGKGADMVIKRCPKLSKIFYNFSNLHLEDCPQLRGAYNEQSHFRLGKFFFKNAGTINHLEIAALESLTVEGEVAVEVITIGDYYSPAPVDDEKTDPAQPPKPFPNVSCKWFRLKRLTPAAIDLLEKNSPVASLKLIFEGDSPSDLAELGWSPEKLADLFSRVEVRDLVISSENPIPMNYLEQLHQCKVTESLRFLNAVSLSKFVEPIKDDSAELPLAERFNLKLPKTIKEIFLPFPNGVALEHECMNVVASRHPNLTITYQRGSMGRDGTTSFSGAKGLFNR